MQRKHCTLGWDSIGSYLEWGSVPSAHNGDANWAAKYREKSWPCQICVHGKSPACQIWQLGWFRHCYTTYLFRPPLLFCFTIHPTPIEWEKNQKLLASNMVSYFTCGFCVPPLCVLRRLYLSIPPYLQHDLISSNSFLCHYEQCR